MQASTASPLVTLWTALALSLSPISAGAFALLGPYADWMQTTNGFRQSDIGGPMALGEEYRWNVPVLTYAFDQLFLDYFGSNGVAAVEQAFQILNDLPPASSLVLSNYPLDSRGWNYDAQRQGLWDLKSVTLALLIEQLGLAAPTRNVFVLRSWCSLFASDSTEQQWTPWATDFGLILERNFDPDTLMPSHCVNDVWYTGYVSGDAYLADVYEYNIDPDKTERPAVADAGLWLYGFYGSGGIYYSSLTRDDVAGLRYLLASNNVNYEPLLPDIHGVGSNATSLVRTAWRPGIEKITFVRQCYDPLLGRAIPLTNQFTDTFITNGTVQQQQVERIIASPDFLFSAADTGANGNGTPWLVPTGTSNWWNSTTATASTNTLGPGVIGPPVKLTFHTLGSCVFSSDTPLPLGQDGTQHYPTQWGSFDGTTNRPLTYPSMPPPNADLLRLRFRLGVNYQIERSYLWEIPARYGGRVALKASSNLTDWITLAWVTNNGTVGEWIHNRSGERRFFHVMAE